MSRNDAKSQKTNLRKIFIPDGLFLRRFNPFLCARSGFKPE